MRSIPTRKTTRSGAAPNSFITTGLTSAYTIEETSVAPFAQFEFSPVENLRLTLGTRYETYDMKADDRSPFSNNDGKTLIPNWSAKPD